MKPLDFLEETLAAEEVGDLKADRDVFEYPRWRVIAWIVTAWAAALFVSWGVLFRSATPVGLFSAAVVAMMTIAAVSAGRGLRRVRIVGTRVEAEFGFGKRSQSWELSQLVPDQRARRWSGQIEVRRRDTGHVAFRFSPYLPGWRRLMAKLSAGGGAA
jgi:hypothetical protein